MIKPTKSYNENGFALIELVAVIAVLIGLSLFTVLYAIPTSVKHTNDSFIKQDLRTVYKAQVVSHNLSGKYLDAVVLNKATSNGIKLSGYAKTYIVTSGDKLCVVAVSTRKYPKAESKISAQLGSKSNVYTMDDKNITILTDTDHGCLPQNFSSVKELDYFDKTGLVLAKK